MGFWAALSARRFPSDLTAERDAAGEPLSGSADFVSFLTAYREAVELPETASDWYLPSYAEWTAIQTNYATISASIEKAIPAEKRGFISIR